jgi:hypothetical protein
LIAASSGSAAKAQISQASLNGTIRDNSGSVAPKATVTLTNKGTGTARTATTDSTGAYLFPDVEPAEYSMTVSLQGFKTLSIASLTLHTGEHATVDGTLELGATSQEITVAAAVPLLNTESSDVGHQVPQSQVAEIPLNGRNFWELAQLTPGSTFIPRSQTSTFNGSELRARNVNVAVNGTSYIFTGWALDGANVTNFELGGNPDLTECGRHSGIQCGGGKPGARIRPHAQHSERFAQERDELLSRYAIRVPAQ